jgi:hypothetical protein
MRVSMPRRACLTISYSHTVSSLLGIPYWNGGFISRGMYGRLSTVVLFRLVELQVLAHPVLVATGSVLAKFPTVINIENNVAC